MAWHGMALILLSGCVPTGAPPLESARGSEPPRVSLLIADVDRSFDFGPVVARPGAQRVHHYQLLNDTLDAITITDVINRKPCCGALRLDKAALAPGESANLELTMSVGDKFGDVVHEAVVVTDRPAADEIVLRTTARALPAVRFEPDGEHGSTVMRGAKPCELAFQVIAYGTEGDPPADLAAASLTGSATARWLDEAESHSDGDGVIERTRRCAVTLSPVGEEGDRRDSVIVEADGAAIYQHMILWQLVPAVHATPKVLVIRPEVTEYRIRLTSADGSDFRVTGIATPDGSIRHAEPSKDLRSAHILTFICDAASCVATGKASVTVTTDHPLQPSLDIPIVIIGR
jgi:hypothetical protein